MNKIYYVNIVPINTTSFVQAKMPQIFKTCGNKHVHIHHFIKSDKK